MSSASPCIVVIGAGTAGLAAADDLISRGYTDVTVLEASNRIGGRVNTMEFGSGNCIIELGANWIHGIENNPMYHLAKSNDLLKPLVTLDRMDGFCYTEDGRRLNKNLVNQIWDFFQSLEEEMDIYFDESIQTDLSVADYLQSRLHKELVMYPEESREDVKSIHQCMQNYYAFHCGDDLTRLSLQCAGSYQETCGPNVKLPHGFTGVIQTLVKHFSKNTLHLNTTVKKILWKTKDCQDPRCLKIFCEEKGKETIYEADHAIFTCSLGVLKECHESLFSPSLSEEKIKSIQRIGFGHVNKIFLEYSIPFWKAGEGSIKLAWHGEKEWKFSEEEWYKQIFGFDEVLNNPTVLVAWISGQGAEYIETLSDDEVGCASTKILRQFTGNNQIPHPKRVMKSAWCSNPLTKGSYSYVSMHSTVDDIAKLSEPLCGENGVPRVLFAGEATHKEWYSTTHGALSSGHRESERLHQYLCSHFSVIA